MWVYASPNAAPGTEDREKALYTHGNHRLEVLWTAVPAAILLFIAFAQIGVWERIKYRSRMPSPDLTVSVLARQWEWRMRYPEDPSRFGYDAGDEKDKALAHRKARSWVENPEIDDVHATNELHGWKGANVKVWVRTLDVIHSLTMPNLRLKQDTLPGKTIPMWFNAEKSNCRFVLKDARGREVPVVFDPDTRDVKVRLPGSDEAVPVAAQQANLKGEMITSGNKKDAWEIACQELCGGRHYAMRGRLYIHEDARSFYTWLRFSRARQRSRSLETAVSLGN
jgi:heme/copper-type cytochrome/quinol oxidase subunit 2